MIKAKPGLWPGLRRVLAAPRARLSQEQHRAGLSAPFIPERHKIHAARMPGPVEQHAVGTSRLQAFGKERNLLAEDVSHFEKDR